jgi:putative FmdB family regulatory protein
MPLYEYKCSSCGELFEVIERFSDEPLKVHEKCGGAVERQLSAPALQFKGTGWYVTDYARKSGGGSNGKSSSSRESKNDTAVTTTKSDPASSSPASSPSSTSKG